MKPLILIRCKCAVAGFAAMLNFATTGGTAVLHVPSNYPTIQAAIHAAASDDEIKIASGVYTEQLVITNKNLTLSGSAGAVLRATPGLSQTLTNYGNRDVALLGVALSDVKVSGLTFEGERLGDSWPTWFDAICYLGSSGSIVDCRVTGFRGTKLVTSDKPEPTGIYFSNGINYGTGERTVEIFHSTFADNAISIWLAGDGSLETDPALLRTSFKVNDNTIVGNGPDALGRQFGIRIAYGAGGEVRRNTITDHAYVGGTGTEAFSHGVLAFDPWTRLQPMHFEGNVFRNNQQSLTLLRADGSIVINNCFEGRVPSYRPGGFYFSGENVMAATNLFKDLETGILIMGNDPDFGTTLGIASNATLIANGFCNVSTNITVEPLATYSEQGTLMTCLQPFLSIRAIQLSWPYWFNGYSVETAPSAHGPWTPSDAAPFPQNGQNKAILPMDGDQQFHRLSRP